ncbi:DUF6171 family protein [bacterium]|nr:DUF6171 family protein [bacterium]
MDKEIKCEFRSGSSCKLGRFGGTADANKCSLCIKHGKNSIEHENPNFSTLNEEEPTLTQKAKNLGKEAKNWAKSGFQMADKETEEARLEICNGCEFFKNGKCSACGCYMKAKAKLATSYCPKGLWPD